MPNPNTQPSRNPTADQLQQREHKPESWKREIERLEQQAKIYA
ncbi:hypothetical protein [Nostoc flagelliforme]|nr:hypothetical protein [Nostoc flagelliforme]